MNYLHNLKKLLPVAIYATLVVCITGNAQEVITPSAGYFEAPSISLNWTIGEIAVETYINDDIILTQGFNQANIVITSATEELLTDISIMVYPNPVQNILTIKVWTDHPNRLKAKVYDLAGTTLISENINQGSTQIDIGSLAPSDYILKICDNKQVIKSLVFLKIN
jgi:hypothetical protein